MLWEATVIATRHHPALVQSVDPGLRTLTIMARIAVTKEEAFATVAPPTFC
jgi:hypothetical protein